MNNQQKLAEFFAELGFKITGKKELNDYSRMLEKLEKQVSDMTISFSRFNETVQKGLARTQLAQLRDLRIRKAKLELQKAEYDASMKQARLETQRAKTKAVADKTFAFIQNSGLVAMGKVNHMNIMTDLGRVRQQEAAVTRELKQQRQERNANDIIAQRQARTSAQIATQEARTATELARQQAVRARMALLGSRGASGGGSGGSRGVALGSAFGAASGALAGFLPGFGIAYSAMNLNRINQELQANQMALTAITGDEASARDTDLRFRERANALGIDWRATQPSFRKMLASGMGAGMSQGDVESIFQGTAEYGRVMGLGTEDMKGTFRAIEQMMNKGQVMSEELKLQLAERMPGVVSAMAEAYGKQIGKEISPADLFKAMETGAVKSDTLIAFAEILSGKARAGGALEKAMKSTAAEQARFNNAFSSFVEVFAKEGFDKTMADFFRNMTRSLEQAEPMAKALAEAFDYIVAPVEALVELFRVAGTEILPRLSEAFGVSEGLLLALGAAAAVAATGPLGLIIVGLSALALVLEDLWVYSQGGDSVFGILLEAFSQTQFGESVGKFATSLTELLATWKELIAAMLPENSEGLRKFFEMFENMNPIHSAIEDLRQLLELLTAVMNVQTALLKGDWEGVKSIVVDAIKRSDTYAMMGAGFSNLPTVDSAALATGTTSGGTVVSGNQITIVQQPGQSAAEVGEEVAKVLGLKDIQTNKVENQQ